jgi:Ca2+-transporting ATPase
MASDDYDFDIPQIDVVGAQDDDNSTVSLSLPSLFLSSDTSRQLPPPSPSGHATSPTDYQSFLSLPSPILRSARTLEALGSPGFHSSDTSSSQSPSPTSYHRRKGSTSTVSSIDNSSTERDMEDTSSLGLIQVPSAHSDMTSTLLSPTHTHVEPGSDLGSRLSFPVGFFRRTLNRVRQRPSPSPSGETDTGSDTTRDDGQKGDNADVNRQGAQLARPAALDLKQEADLDVRPFAFKPLQLASLVDPKSLETLEGMGGVDALLSGLGSHPTHGLTTKIRMPQSHHVSPVLIPQIPQSPKHVHTVDKDPPKPIIMITSPAGEPQGLQSSTSLASSSGVDLPSALQSSEDVYRTSIEDRQRIFGQNVLPQTREQDLTTINVASAQG